MNSAIQPITALQPYSGIVFDALANHPVTDQQLESYREAIAELGRIICRYHYEDVIGVSVLHKPFPLQPNERLIRQFPDPGRALTRPTTERHIQERSLPYLWTFAYLNGSYGWFPLEFITWDDEYCVDLFLIESAEGLFDELALALALHNAQNVLGITGLFSRQQFQLRPDTALLEITDAHHRVLEQRVVAKDIVGSSDISTTLWIFSPDEKERLPCRYMTACNNWMH